MQKQNFWYHSEAKSMNAVPTGTKAGQFLVLSAQTSINLDTGEIIRDLIDLPPEVSRSLCAPVQTVTSAYFGPIMAQTWTIYQNLSKILAKQGASLKDVIRQRVFLRDIRDAEWMEMVMLPFFPEEKPTTLIIGVADKGLHPDIRMWVEVMALIPQKGGLVKEAIYLPELKKVSEPYPQAVKVGQFLFFEGMIGIDPKSGHPVTSLDELKSKAGRGITGRYIDSSFEASKAQYWLCYDGHIRRILESQGGGIDDILYTYTFRKHGIRMFSETDYMREKFYSSIETAPTSEGFGILKPSIIPEVEIITGGVALLPGEYKKETLKYDTLDRGGTYAGLTKAGPFWFAAGTVPTDFVKQKHIVNFGDLTDNGRFLAESRIDFSQLTMAKVWHVYSTMIDEINTKASQVMQQSVYLTNPAEWPAFERVASIFFKGSIPATTIIPIDECAFYWQSHMGVPHSVGGPTVEMGMWGLT